MKKLVILLFTLFLFASEGPYSVGAYYGNIKLKIKDLALYSYPSNSYAYAGKLYLYKNKKDIADYITEKKIALIASALDEAKKFAKEKHKKFYAIDNIKFDIKLTDNIVYVFVDYNVLAFDE